MPKSTTKAARSYRSLELREIVRTISQLQQRISERFPNSGLSQVAADLLTLSEGAEKSVASFSRPNIGLRVLTVVVVLTVASLLVRLVLELRWNNELFDLEHFLQSFEALLGSVALVGAAVFSLFSFELRIKRHRALHAIHELRALTHIIDMHQLTKDPEGVTGRGPSTISSPKRTMTPFELGRYLDYCSELLSLVTKVGAYYVQMFNDPVALEAVDQLATLTNGLTRNIWQKIMLVEQITRQTPTAGADAPPCEVKPMS